MGIILSSLDDKQLLVFHRIQFLIALFNQHVRNVYALYYTKNKYHLFFTAKFYISLEKTDRMEISALFLRHIK